MYTHVSFTLQAQAESTKQALERHVENQRSSYVVQTDSLTDQLDQALKDNKLLKRDITEKQRVSSHYIPIYNCNLSQ